MNLASRVPVGPTSIPSASALGWIAAWTVLLTGQFMVVRACGYDVGPWMAYAAYFTGHVCLPGVVVMAALQRGPISITTAIALGIPTGFAIEISSFLGLAALGAKEFLRVLPVVWLAVGLGLWRRWGKGLVRCRLTPRHAGLVLALSLLFLVTVIAAASHMFAESPLVAGLPQRPIFHDWVYLISRAASIKHHWPLEDPSLAGSALQYHYFLLVHVASASLVTGVETSLVLLRLVIVPLGAVLVVQAYVLGRRLARSPWGGVLAALLTVAAGEVAFSQHPNTSVFLGRFVRWLYVSPTFYFGLIYFAAILLAVMRWEALRRRGFAHFVWLFGLAAVATGAKGTVMPVLLVSLGLWVAWRWTRNGELPGRLVGAGVCMAAAFAGVYYVTMSQWNTGAAEFVPFDIFGVSGFWQQALPRWELWLAQWLPANLVHPIASLGCGLVVLAGTDGVRLLAIPFLLLRHQPRSQRLVEWLGAAWLGSAAMGLLMKLDADGELYLFLMVRLPTAVLAAAFLVEMWRRFRRQSSESGVVALPRPQLGSAWRRQCLPLLAVALIAVALTVQTAGWWVRNRVGMANWLRDTPGLKVDEGMQRLQEALLWVRQNTERDAVLVANTYTAENLKKDHWAAVDGTLAGVHYYYSALSERRLLVEGPNYLLDPVQVNRRMKLAGDIFHRGRAPTTQMFGGMPCYALLDRSVPDGATVSLPANARVFANARIEIYRVPRGYPALLGLAADDE